MQAQFQAYSRIIKDFYSKVVRNHPHSTNLCNNLSAMIEQISSQQHGHHNSLGIRKKHSDLSVSARSHSRRSKNNIDKADKNIPKNLKNQCLFTHENFGTVLAFAYIYLLIDIENNEIFKMTQTKINLLINTDILKNQSNRIEWEHSIMEWKKVARLLEHKRAVKWQKILSTAFLSFDIKFTQIILRSMLNMGVSAKFQRFPSKQILQKIEDSLKITIQFCQFEGEVLKQKNIYGSYKSTIKLGQTNALGKKMYSFYTIFPNQQQDPHFLKINQSQNNDNIKRIKSQRQINFSPIENSSGLRQDSNLTKSYRMINNSEQRDSHRQPRSVKMSSGSSLIRKKSLITIQFLLKQFKLNSQKLNSLQCLSWDQGKTKNGLSNYKNSSSNKHQKYY